MSLHFSLPKNFTLVPPLSLRAELTLRVAKNIALFETFIFPRKYCSFRFVSVKWGVKESNKLNKVIEFPTAPFFFTSKKRMDQIKTRNYWE